MGGLLVSLAIIQTLAERIWEKLFWRAGFAFECLLLTERIDKTTGARTSIETVRALPWITNRPKCSA
jgi:hypothetical protein